MTDEDIKKLALALKSGDHDSFATFRGGLRENWPFVMAIVGLAVWLFQSFGNIETTNLNQDSAINSNTQNIAELTAVVERLASQQDGSDEVSFQVRQDIALIKADVATIKASLKPQ